jgi:hypothetical protein
MNWIKSRGKNFNIADVGRAAFTENDARNAHSRMAQANDGKGNPKAGI